ncbi:MAG: ABC transporter ATP-binding protein [Betaproteobacteria bacterium]
MSLLKVEGLQVHYGGIQALKAINFEVKQGERVALIGANGAGKTTTLKAIAGLLKLQQGHIFFNGNAIDNTPAHARVGLGIALVPEGRGVFAHLTVADNLLMGAYLRQDRTNIRSDLERYYALFPRLAQRQKQWAGTLSGGEQQMLAIARALMSRPRLLLLDEPSMGLAPLIVKQIFNTLIEITQEGVTLLLVEQNAKLALQTCERAYVLDEGLVSLSGAANDLLKDPKVIHAYLGA